MSRPVARPLASSKLLGTPWTRTGSSPASAGEDSHLVPLRISSSRLLRLASQLSPTDQAVLSLVSRSRLCSGDQLERLFWPDGTPAARARRARRALTQLTDWHLLARLPRPIGGRRSGSRGYLYSLGPAGARLLALQYGTHVKRLFRPSDRLVAHTLAITEVVVGLQLAAREGQLDLIEVQSEPECWRAWLGTFGSRQILHPDLFVRIGVGAFEDRYFVEVDMATEHRGTLLTKSKKYIGYFRSGTEQSEHGIFPAVIWAVPTVERAEQLKGLLNALAGGRSAPVHRLPPR